MQYQRKTFSVAMPGSKAVHWPFDPPSNTTVDDKPAEPPPEQP